MKPLENGSRGMEARQKFIALIGTGSGPKVAIRSERTCVRIRGLNGVGTVRVELDGGVHSFGEDGDFLVEGSEFAKVVAEVETPVICELIV